MLHRFAESLAALRASCISYEWRQLGLIRRTLVWSSIVVLALGLRLFVNPVAWADAWHWYHLNRDDITPLGTFAGAAVVAGAALRQAKTARLRHEQQTEADRQRRITENFSKATDQLGNEKLAVRLGAIYTMERISRESPEYYWPVLETLTAFVRDKAHWTEPSKEASESVVCPSEAPGAQPGDYGIPTDVAAVLSVIGRREKVNYEREIHMGWRINLRGTDLRRAGLSLAHLKGVQLSYAHLEGADLSKAHLEGAHLSNAHLEGAILSGAYLEGADLVSANLQRATLRGAHLEGAILMGAHLQGANLGGATGPGEAQLASANGDASTHLPWGVARPAAWPSEPL